MVDRITGMTLDGGIIVETVLDPAEQPYLDHHRIDGTPVLPGVMGIEGFVEVARLFFPKRHVVAVEDVEFLSPFKFYRDQPRAVTLQARFEADDNDVVACCRLTGSRVLLGGSELQVTTHFTGRVRLSQEPPAAGIQPVPAQEEHCVAAEDLYRVYFHGPSYRVVEAAWRHGDEVIGRMVKTLPPAHRPETIKPLMEPRLLELCFQTAGIWELGTTGRLGLPLHVDRVSLLRRPNGANRLVAVATHDGGTTSGFDAYVVDEHGNVYLVLRGYRTIELPAVAEPEVLAPLKAAMGQ